MAFCYHLAGILLQKIGEKAFILQSSYIFTSLLRMRIDIHKRGYKKKIVAGQVSALSESHQAFQLYV